MDAKLRNPNTVMLLPTFWLAQRATCPSGA
jgi:hypothetical protein